MLPERLSDGQFPGYAFPGGYPLVYLTRDGSCVCSACASRDVDLSQAVIAADVHYEGEPISCDDCGAEIESAYGVPDDE